MPLHALFCYRLVTIAAKTAFRAASRFLGDRDKW